MTFQERASQLPKITFIYDEGGGVYTNIIEWRGEKIQVLSECGNGPTRELQRSDEIVQALIKAQVKL